MSQFATILDEIYFDYHQKINSMIFNLDRYQDAVQSYNQSIQFNPTDSRTKKALHQKNLANICKRLIVLMRQQDCLSPEYETANENRTKTLLAIISKVTQEGKTQNQ